MSTAAERRIGLVLLGAALVIAALLMFPVFRQPALLLDEHVSYWLAGSENPGGLMQRSLDYAATPPGSALAQRAAIVMCGKSAAALRAPAILGFLLAVAGTYVLGRRCAGPLAGGAAALILALHPEVVDWMRVARPYGLAVGLSAWSLVVTWRWSEAPQRWTFGIMWGLLNALLLWTHYLNAPLVALQVLSLCGVPMLRIPSWNQRPRGLLVVIGTLVVTVAPLAAAVRRLVEWAPFLNYRDEPPPMQEMLGPLWWAGLPAGWLGAFLIARAARGAAIGGSSRPPAGRQREAAPPLRNTGNTWTAFAWWGLSPLIALAVAAIVWSPTLGEMRYRLVYAPASAVLLAIAVTRGRIVPAAALGITLLLAVSWSVSGAVPWRSTLLAAPAAPDWQQLARIVQDESRSGEVLFVSSGLIESRLVPALYADPLFMDYVACRMGRFSIETELRRQALPWYWTPAPELLDHYAAELTGVEESRRAVWIAGGTDTDLGRGVLEGLAAFLRTQGYREAQRWETPAAVLLRFERDSTSVSIGASDDRRGGGPGVAIHLPGEPRSRRY